MFRILEFHTPEPKPLFNAFLGNSVIAVEFVSKSPTPIQQIIKTMIKQTSTASIMIHVMLIGCCKMLLGWSLPAHASPWRITVAIAITITLMLAPDVLWHYTL